MVVFSCAANGRRDCGREARDVGLRVDGCAVLGAGDRIGGGIDFVGDDSVMGRRWRVCGAKAKTVLGEFLRPGKLGHSSAAPLHGHDIGDGQR